MFRLEKRIWKNGSDKHVQFKELYKKIQKIFISTPIILLNSEAANWDQRKGDAWGFLYNSF